MRKLRTTGWVGLVIVAAIALLLSQGAVGWAAEAEEMLHEAARHFSAGEHEQAEAACRDILKAAPEAESWARLLLAEIYTDQQRIEDALEEAKEAQEAADEELAHAAVQEVLTRLAQRKLQLMGAAEQAEKNLAAARTPEEEVKARLRLGDALAGLGRTEEALAHYEAVTEKFSNSSAAVAQALGRIELWGMRHLGPDRTASRLERIAAAQPDSMVQSYAWYYLGRLHERTGETQRAIACYEAAVGTERARAVPDGLARLAVLHHLAGDLPKGIAAAKRVLGEFVESRCAPGVLEELSAMFSEAGALEDAMATLTQFAQANRGQPLANKSLEDLCRVYRSYDRLAEAVGAVKNIVVVFPEEWDTSGVAQVCVEEAEELAAAGGEEEAIDWWEEAISLLDDENEQRAELLILIAVRHGARKEYEPARDALRKVLDAPPSISVPRRLVAQEYMASLYWQQEMKRQALEAMEAALLIAIEEQKPEREKDIHEAIARLKRELGEQQ